MRVMVAFLAIVCVIDTLAAPPDPNRLRIEQPPPRSIVRPYEKTVREFARLRKQREGLILEISRLRTAAYMPSSNFHTRCERAVEFADRHGLNRDDIVTEEIQEIEDRFNDQHRKAPAVPPVQFALNAPRLAE